MNQIKSSRPLAALLLLSLVSLSMKNNPSTAAELMPMRIGQEVYLHSPDHAIMEPHFMLGTPDNGVLVAGGENNARKAWAFKLDAANKMEWSYFRAMPPAEQARLENDSISPAYRGAAAKLDGGVFLCGNTSFNSVSSNMFLTRLDKAGKLIGESSIVSKYSRPDMVYRIDRCVSWGGGIAIFAHEGHYPAPGSNDVGPTVTYLAMMFDQNGKLEWERLIPTLSKGFEPDADGVVLVAMKQSLLISVTDNVNTEVIAVDTSGAVTAKRKLDGRYLFVHSTSDNEYPRLYGTGRDQSFSTILSLGQDLSSNIVARGASAADFVVRHVFEKRDGSLLLFGSEIHTGGERLRAGIRHVDAMLRTAQRFGPNYRQRLDPTSIWAACIRQDAEGFAFATMSSLASSETRSMTQAQKAAVTGAVVEFVN